MTTTSQAVAPPIGFRPESTASGPSVAFALLATLALLAVVVVALAFARRKGWLDRWTIAPVRQEDGLRVTARVRLSPRTVVYELRDGERCLHVVESSAHVVLQQRSE